MRNFEMGGGVMFDPEKVKRWDSDRDGEMYEVSNEEFHPVLTYVNSLDFDEMKSWWEERGREIDDLYEKLGKIGEIVGLSE